MAIVYIEEVGGPIRVCSKQATADALGVTSADVDLSELAHPTEHYTLLDGVLVELTDVITEAAVVAEEAWVTEQLTDADVAVRKHDDGHGRVDGTKAEWRTYRNALRDHIQSGVIMGSRPTKPGAPV